MKKRMVIASLLGLILVLAMSVPAMARHTPQNSHHHHLVLPNGTCLDIVSVHTGMDHAKDNTDGVSRVEIHHNFGPHTLGCADGLH